MDTNTENNPFNKDIEENTEEKNSQAEKIEEEQQEENKEQNDFEEKYEDLNNKYIRLAADFDNFRKRTLQEKEDLVNYATANLLKKITNVLDTFERAQEHLKDIEDPATIKEGWEVAYKQLVDTLKKSGLEEIEALNKPFNPNEHEAVTQIPTDEFEPDNVAVVMQKGYKLGERIVRPAMVGVAIPKENKENE